MQYIGARYVPKFMGSYDATISYENLCVVDDGMGTSYISNKPVPVGTPLTNRDYWAVYGVTSGAIINLQDQIDAIVAHNTALSVKALSEYTTNDLTLADALNDDTCGVLILDEDTQITATIDIDRDNPLYVFGLNHRIFSIKLALIHIINGTSNITFDGVEFAVYDFTKADLLACNMIEVAPIDYNTIASDNITIKNCDIHGGNIALVFSYASNITIEHCHIHDLHFPTGAGSGGYGLLTQVVQNLYVNDNVFDEFNEGRHDIYISTMPGTSSGPHTKNVHICNNIFDHSSFNSDTIDSTSVQFRQCEGAMISNNLFKQCAQILVTNPTSFDVTGVNFNNNELDEMVKKPATVNDCINIIGDPSGVLKCELSINDFIVKKSSEVLFRLIEAHDCTLTGANLISLADSACLLLTGNSYIDLKNVNIKVGAGYKPLYSDATANLSGNLELYSNGNNTGIGAGVNNPKFLYNIIYYYNNAVISNDIMTTASVLTYDSGTQTFSVTFPTITGFITSPVVKASNGLVYSQSISGNVLTFKLKDDSGTALSKFTGTIEIIK